MRQKKVLELTHPTYLNYFCLVRYKFYIIQKKFLAINNFEITLRYVIFFSVLCQSIYQLEKWAKDIKPANKIS